MAIKHREDLAHRRQKLLAGLALGIAIVAAALVCWFVGRPMLALARQPDRFRAWVDAAGPWGRLGYLGMVILQILIAVLPGEPLEIVGGYAFGAVEGTALCLLGAALGSILVFALVRRFGVRLVEVFFTREKLDSLGFLKTSPRRTALLFVLCTIPGTPKDLLCYFAGLTDLKWRTWLLICLVGRIPSVITSTIGGAALGLGNYTFAFVAFAVTLAVSGLGVLGYRLICSPQTREKQSSAEGSPPPGA